MEIKKIKLLSDLKAIPTVLTGVEVNNYIMQVLDLSEFNSDSVEVCDAINDLIGSQEFASDGLTEQVSLRLLEWIKSNYDSSNSELMECCSANLVCLKCAGVEEYLEERISMATNPVEQAELRDSLLEYREYVDPNVLWPRQ